MINKQTMELSVCYDVIWHVQHVEHPEYVGLKFIHKSK